MNYLLKNTIPFLLITLISCSVNKNKQDSTVEIYYEAATRGSSINIIYKENKIDFKSNSEQKSILLSEDKVEKIKALITDIKLSEIHDLTAPSNKRFTDGALSANFTIKKEGVRYISSDFDHKNPPKELKELYLLLEKYTK